MGMRGLSGLVRTIRFGDFEVDLQARELRKHRLRLKLQQKPFQILELLLRRAGEVVTRKELRDKLWPGTFVGFDRSLNTAINTLRQALGDSTASPRFVETRGGLGYRFIAPVEAFGRASPPNGRIMLAVLPVAARSDDAEQDYFADGLTEEMIAQLGHLSPKRIGVIARTSAMHYKGASKSIEQIGQELGVDYVLEGSVRREGGRVRIGVQLIEVGEQTYLWTESYERDLADMFSVQSEVARSVAHSLSVELLLGQQEGLLPVLTTSPAAHEACLKARYHWHKFTPAGLQKGLEYSLEAIQKDPNYALAYIGLSISYAVLGSGYGPLPPKDAFPKAKQAALRALEIGNAAAEAHTALGLVKLFYDWDWSGAEQEIMGAIELNPNCWMSHNLYAFYLQAFGQTEEAIVEAKRALEFDPLSLISNADLGLALYLAREYDRAIEQCRKTLEMDRHFVVAHEYLGRAYVQMMRFEEAIAEFQAGVSLCESGGNSRFPSFLGYTYALSGRRREALQVLDDLTLLSTRGYVPFFNIARVYAGLGKKDQAFQWLEKACEARDFGLHWLRVDPEFDPLRPDPRFNILLGRVGLLAQSPTLRFPDSQRRPLRKESSPFANDLIEETKVTSHRKPHREAPHGIRDPGR